MRRTHGRQRDRVVRGELDRRGAGRHRAAGAGIPGAGPRGGAQGTAARPGAGGSGRQPARRGGRLRGAVAVSRRDAHVVLRSEATSRPSTAASCPSARTQAIEVERVSDDPPERVQEWLATVSDAAVRQLDLSLLQDLLRLETDPARWQEVANVGVAEIERRTLLGEVERRAAADGRDRARVGGRRPRGLAAPAEAVLNKLAGGPLVRHIVTYLRKADETDVEPLNRLCHDDRPAHRAAAGGSAGRRRQQPRDPAVCASCCSASAPPAGSRSSS